MKHLAHLEDLAFSQEGLDFAFDVLYEFSNILDAGRVSKRLTVSTKWDGSPAMVFGKDPADGRLFVSTKSALNKTPKLAHSDAEIGELFDASYASVIPRLSAVLKEIVPGLGTNVPILGADFLFSSDMVQRKAINGKNYLTFQPNTILYAVDESSDLARRMHRAAVGLAVHTAFRNSWAPSPITPLEFVSLRPSERVLLVNAAYDDMSGRATFTAEESEEFGTWYDQARLYNHNLPVSFFGTVQPVRELLERFVNHTVRTGAVTPEESVTKFASFILTKAVPRADYKAGIVLQNSAMFFRWFQLHEALALAKGVIVRKLASMSAIATFVPTEDGFRVTGPEGFVAISYEGRAVKLVDRFEFSRLNFQRHGPK